MESTSALSAWRAVLPSYGNDSETVQEALKTCTGDSADFSATPASRAPTILIDKSIIRAGCESGAAFRHASRRKDVRMLIQEPTSCVEDASDNVLMPSHCDAACPRRIDNDNDEFPM